MDIYPNDLMNYFDFIKQFRKKSEYEGPISYEYSKQDYPFTFKIINFYDARVIISGNTIKIFVHEFDL